MEKHNLTFQQMIDLANRGAVEPIVAPHIETSGKIHSSQYEHVKRIAELARIRGDDVEVMMGKIMSKKPKKSREFLASYADETWRSLQGKHPNDFTDDQVDALGRVLGMHNEFPAESEQSEEERLEQERKRTREFLEEIQRQDEKEGKPAFSGLLGTYGGRGYSSGGYVGGEKGGVPDFDRLRAYGARSSDPDRWSKELDILQSKYEAPLKGDTGRAKIGQFMSRFVGQSEWNGANQGPLVAMTMGAEGVPYCGGGMRMIVNRALGADFYDAKDWRSAVSALNVGREFGALKTENFKKSDFKAGDIVVFEGSGPSRCHVGMISRVDAQGNAYYVDFNGGNTVKEAPLRGRTVVGLVDIEVLAYEKTKRKSPEAVAGKSPAEVLEQLISDNEARLKAQQKAQGLQVDGSNVAAVVIPPQFPAGVTAPERAPAAALG